MANTLYSINHTTGTINDISTALSAKYGAGLTIHNQTTTDLIFSCSAISDKVMRMRYYNNRLTTYYGNAWTSGTTITNQVQWAGYDTSSTSQIALVLGNEFLLASAIQGTINSAVMLAGKLTSGEFAVIGTVGTSTSSYNGNSRCVNTTTGFAIAPNVFSEPFNDSTGKLYTQPILLVNASTGLLLTDSGGDPATFIGVENVSFAPGNNAITIGTNYLVSPSNQYYADSNILRTSWIATF